MQEKEKILGEKSLFPTKKTLFLLNCYDSVRNHPRVNYNNWFNTPTGLLTNPLSFMRDFEKKKEFIFQFEMKKRHILTSARPFQK